MVPMSFQFRVVARRRYRSRALRCLSRFAAVNLIAIQALAPSYSLAQESTAPQGVLTVEKAKEFLKAAGLETCEVSELDPMVSKQSGAIASLSLGVAADCNGYDPKNPTVVNVHQFADEEARDAMIASLQNLRFRALQAYADVWAIDKFVLVLLGPQRAEAEAMIKAEYRRRHPGTE